MSLVIAFVIAFGITLVVTPLLGRLARAMGLVDRPDGDGLKIHDEPIPLAGGVGVIAAVVTATVLAGGWLPASIAGAMLVALIAGLIDDFRALPVWSRIALQGAAGGFVIAASLPWEYGAAGAVATILLVMASANAVNLLDGQDGLVAGCGVVACLGLAMLLREGEGSVAVDLALATAGAMLGFLIWNRPPARVFLGNGGAYALGTILAILAKTLVVFEGWRGALAAGVCLSVLGFELAFTVVRRVVSGRSLARGDRMHSYDLVAVAMNRNASMISFWIASVAVASAAVIAYHVGLPALIASAALVAATAVVAGFGLWRRAAAASERPDPARVRPEIKAGSDP